MGFPNFLLNCKSVEMIKCELGQAVPLRISLVRVRNWLPIKLGTQKGFSSSRCQMWWRTVGESLPFSRNRGIIPSGIMSFSPLAPKELTQWADVRTLLAASQMQTIEHWPASTKENFWSHGIALASQKCITRPQLSTIVSLHKEGKDWGGEVMWAYTLWWSLRKSAQRFCLFALCMMDCFSFMKCWG